MKAKEQYKEIIKESLKKGGILSVSKPRFGSSNPNCNSSFSVYMKDGSYIIVNTSSKNKSNKIINLIKINNLIVSETHGRFEHFFNENVSPYHKSIFISEYNKQYNGTIGKYMFSSDNRDELVNLAKETIAINDLYTSKVSIDKGIHPNYLLCVYDYEERVTSDMSKKSTDSIEFGGWKSDEDTITGK